MHNSQARQQLEALQEALDELAKSQLTAASFSALAEKQVTLLATLPPRYTEVLTQLLTRLESSALFTEESCSFSHKDLLDSLRLWLEKAQGILAKSDSSRQNN